MMSYNQENDIISKLPKIEAIPIDMENSYDFSKSKNNRAFIL